MKRSVTANAGKDYTCHVGDAGSSPACLATGSSVMGSTPALRSDVFSNPRRRDASSENSRPWRMPVGLHPANEVRRVNRLGNQEMRVRIPPMGRSLRTASRHLSSPRLQGRKIAANAGRTTSPCKRQVAGSSPAGSIMGARSSVGRAGGLSKPSSPRNEYRRECRPARTTFALVRKGLGYFLVPPPNKAGECR